MGKHRKVVSVKTLFRLSTGRWTFRFGHAHLHFKFLSSGRILFGKRKVKLVASKVKRFPASQHWFTVKFSRYVYYMRLTASGASVMFKFSTKKVKGCKHSMKGVKKLYLCGKGSGGKVGRKHRTHVKIHVKHHKHAKIHVSHHKHAKKHKRHHKHSKKYKKHHKHGKKHKKHHKHSKKYKKHHKHGKKHKHHHKHSKKYKKHHKHTKKHKKHHK